MEESNTIQDFRTRFEQSKVAEAKRQALIQDLIDENDRLARSSRKMALDLENEVDARRRLQDRISSSQNRKSFVLVLIDADGDGYVFRDNFLNKNEEGGREAADELLVQVHKHVGDLGLDVNKTDVVVRAYANLRGLSKFCARDGLMNATADVGLFANGFTKRQPLFDFVDVGLGKERADNKVRERFVADDSVQGRITMLAGHQVSWVIRELRFKTVEFPSVFAGPPVSNTRGNSIQPQSTAVKQANRAAKGRHSLGAVDQCRLRPVLKNQEGLRMDRPLAVDTGVVQALKKKNLCVWLFLRGRCDGCPRNHAHPSLSDEEQDALWVVARQGASYVTTHCARTGMPLGLGQEFQRRVRLEGGENGDSRGEIGRRVLRRGQVDLRVMASVQGVKLLISM
ncbi:MAG: hypothetical protein Q9193_006243, partial [Seirophora villosa]